MFGHWAFVETSFLDTIALIDQEAWRIRDGEYMRWLEVRCKAQVQRNDDVLYVTADVLRSAIGDVLFRFSCELREVMSEAASSVRESQII